MKLKYRVVFQVSGEEPKVLKEFDNYEDTMDFYLDKLREEFHYVGRIPTKLRIEYLQNNVVIGTERLQMISDD